MSMLVDYRELAREAGRYLGAPKDLDQCTDDQLEDINDVIKAGYADFLYPENGHRWGFLSPVHQLETDTDVEDYALPPEFGGIAAPEKIYYSAGDGSWVPIDVVSVSRILHLRASYLSSNTGRSRVAAVNNRAGSGVSEQRSTLMIWPKPDSNYTLKFQMISVPPMLSLDNPIPWGSREFGETIKSCVLAAAAIKFETADSPRLIAEKQRRIQAATAVDKRRNRGRQHGMNRDNSDSLQENLYREEHKVTYGGVIYDGGT